MMPELGQDDFEALLDLDSMGEKGAWSFDDGGIHGFTRDMDWFSAGVDMKSVEMTGAVV